MASIDRKRLARAVRQLRAGIRAHTFEAADTGLERFRETALRSERNLEAGFAAVQRLRDLEVIDRAEAASLFSTLLDSLEWDRIGSDDPGLQQAIAQDVDWELIYAAMHNDEHIRAVAFFRDRGEEELARMVAQQPDAYGTLCAEGTLSLLEDKPRTAWLENPEPARPVSPALGQRVLALSAAETITEWHPAWQALWEELRGTEPAGAVAAIQGLREVGSISFEESLALIDMAIDPIVDGMLAVDREFHRLGRALEAARVKLNIDLAAPDASQPLEYQVIEYLRLRRADNITAVVLRQFGEHRMANLINSDPEKFNKMRDDGTFGVERA